MEAEVAEDVSGLRRLMSWRHGQGGTPVTQETLEVPEFGLLQHWPEPWTKRPPRLTLHAAAPCGTVTRCGRSGPETYQWLSDWPDGVCIQCAARFLFHP